MFFPVTEKWSDTLLSPKTPPHFLPFSNKSERLRRLRVLADSAVDANADRVAALLRINVIYASRARGDSVCKDFFRESDMKI